METMIATPESQLNMESLIARLAEQDLTIAKLEKLVKFYEDQFKLLKRRQYGSTSEKTDTCFQQMDLWGETEAAEPPESEPGEITYKRKKR